MTGTLHRCLCISSAGAPSRPRRQAWPGAAPHQSHVEANPRSHAARRSSGVDENPCAAAASGGSRARCTVRPTRAAASRPPTQYCRSRRCRAAQWAFRSSGDQTQPCAAGLAVRAGLRVRGCGPRVVATQGGRDGDVDAFGHPAQPPGRLTGPIGGEPLAVLDVDVMARFGDAERVPASFPEPFGSSGQLADRYAAQLLRQGHAAGQRRMRTTPARAPTKPVSLFTGENVRS